MQGNFSDYKNYSFSAEIYNETIMHLLNNKQYKINPEFQREYVWSLEKASLLIETIIMGLPVPPIYIYYSHDTQYIIDGQQRLSSIKKFVEGNFILKGLKIFGFLNDLYFDMLPETYKRRILDYKLDFYNIKNIHSTNIIFEIFKRLNVAPINLNAQEIRNCVYHGPLTKLINDLSNYKPFKLLFEDAKIDQTDKEEYVLRFLALYQNFDNYRGNINEFLNEYLEAKNYLINNQNEYDTHQEFKDLKRIFMKAVDACIIVFGKDVFRNCLNFQTLKGTKNIMYKSFSKPVFDLQMLGFADFDFALINRFSTELKEKYEKEVLNDEKFRPYFKKMSRRALTYRVNKWKEYIKEIIDD